MLKQKNKYAPDVLDCIANLSNDEVFTSPKLANQMLDMVPQELFTNPEAKFLDPCCKSGVFLREIVKRLDKGLETVIPDRQKRIDHILHKQVYGIAITELTAQLSRRTLYCSKYACAIKSGDIWISDDNDSEHGIHESHSYSISEFTQKDVNDFCINPIQGNVRFNRKIKHNYSKGDTCPFCGANKGTISEYNHVSELIHMTEKELEVLKNMQWDLIIGNPPYHVNVGVEKDRYAIPIYQKFIEQSKKLNPRYLSMIIPARWYAGGRFLDDFRHTMLTDKRITKLYDFPNPYDCFQGVDNPGGICYFLWDKDNKSETCEFTSCVGNEKTTLSRRLDEFPLFIRDAKGLAIVKKIMEVHSGEYMDATVSGQNPFGILTSYKPLDEGIPCWFKQKIGLKYVDDKDMRDSYNCLDKYKLLIPKAPIAGQTDFTKAVGLYYEGNIKIAKPGECCSQSWLVAYSASTIDEVNNFKSYLLTKIVRFLILQVVVSQDVGRNRFCFVPKLDSYDYLYSDELLKEKWGITEEEWRYIDSRIHNYGI